MSESHDDTANNFKNQNIPSECSINDFTPSPHGKYKTLITKRFLFEFFCYLTKFWICDSGALKMIFAVKNLDRNIVCYGFEV
jgi:hypothetical protein